MRAWHNTRTRLTNGLGLFGTCTQVGIVQSCSFIKGFDVSADYSNPYFHSEILLFTLHVPALFIQ